MSAKPKLSHDLKFLFLATLFFGAASGIFMATLNNYLSDVHSLDAATRGWLEFPRELPGFLVIFVAAGLLSLMRETKMAAIAMILSAAGAIGLGMLASDTFLLVAFIIIWSMGDHIILALEGPIGLRVAKDGATGRRLGQLGGARNLGVISGVGLIYLLARLLGDRYDIFYLVASISALLAGVAYLQLRIGKGEKRSRRFVFKKKYGIFYAISALFGVRKQIFLAFGGWVLVKIHGVPVSTIAMLYFAAAVLGVIFRPLLGDVIDWLGERSVLAVTAKYVLYGAYIFDSVLFALRIARTTYLQKIADSPDEITPTISMGVTIDHLVAMSLPILSGYVWEKYSFRWVFIIAAGIALAGFFICLRIRTPQMNTASAGLKNA